MTDVVFASKEEQLAALQQHLKHTQDLITHITGSSSVPRERQGSWAFADDALSKQLGDVWRYSYDDALASLLNPAQYLAEQGFGSHESAAIATISALGVAEHLPNDGSPVPLKELAKKTDASENRLRAVLRSCRRINLVRENVPLSDEWCATRITRLLRKDSDAPVGALIDYAFDKDVMDWTLRLPELCRLANASVTGPQLAWRADSFFSWLAIPENSWRATRFNDMIKGVSNIVTAGPTLDWPWQDVGSDQVVVDVGGGVGAQTISLVSTHPNLRVLVQDLEGPVNAAKELWSTLPKAWSDRVTFQVQDFFQPQPAELAARTNIYFERFVLHDWSDSKAIEILRALRKNARADAKLLLLEMIVTGSDSRYVDVLSIHLLGLGGAQERSEAEFEELLLQAGWELVKVHSTRTDMGVLEAKPRK